MKPSATLDLFGCQKLYGFVKMLHFQLFFEERFLKFAVLLLETKYNFFFFFDGSRSALCVPTIGLTQSTVVTLSPSSLSPLRPSPWPWSLAQHVRSCLLQGRAFPPLSQAVKRCQQVVFLGCPFEDPALLGAPCCPLASFPYNPFPPPPCRGLRTRVCF